MSHCIIFLIFTNQIDKMGLVIGKDVIVKIFDESVSDYVAVGCGRSVTFEMSADTIETSVTGAGKFKTFVPAGLQISGTIEGLVWIQKDISTKLDLGHLYDYMMNSQTIELLYYETDQTNTYFLQKGLFAIIESITETASFDNITTFSLSFKGTGSPVITYGEV